VRYEPPVDRIRLIETVRDAYEIPARELTFVPVGFAAACYVLHCAGGDRRFLKLWPQLRLGEAAADRQHASLALTRALYDRDLYPRVPYPIPTRRGTLWADLSGTPFAVFPLLPGEHPPAALTAALREELGRTLATIHLATPALADVLPPRETFDIGFEPELHRGLGAAVRIGPGARPVLLALRDWALLHQEEIAAQLARLRRLQERVRWLDGPRVLCHTDLLGDNALVDDLGRLSVLDWDDATVAPPEHDLWVALGENLGGEGFAGVLDVYREAGGAGPLHLDHFAFYLLRRYLGDMTARMDRLLAEGSDVQEDEELLFGMDAYGRARWTALDDMLAVITAAPREGDPPGQQHATL
jgi:spectinomycin phosphotransferase